MIGNTIPIQVVQSFGFSLSAWIIILIVIIKYYSKNKDLKRNKLFEIMLWICLYIDTSNIAMTFLCYDYIEAAADIKLTLDIMARVESILNFGIVYVFGLYLADISNKQNNNINMKTHYIVITIIGILGSILTLFYNIDFTLEFGYYGYRFRPDDSILLIGAGIPLLYCAYIVIFKKIKLEKEQKSIIFFFIFVALIIFIYQVINNIDWNSMGFVASFLTLTLYFCLESQDTQKINTLLNSKNNIEKETTKYVNHTNRINNELSMLLNNIVVSKKLLEITPNEKESIQEEINSNYSKLRKMKTSIEVLDSIRNDEFHIKSEQFNFKNFLLNISTYCEETFTNNIMNVNYDENMPNVYKSDNNAMNLLITNFISSLTYSGDNEELTLNILYNKTYLSFQFISNNKILYNKNNINYVIFENILNAFKSKIKISANKKNISFDIPMDVIDENIIGSINYTSRKVFINKGDGSNE